MTVVLGFFTAFLVAATILPKVRVAHGFFRVFSFPRLQFASLALVMLPLTVWLVEDAGWRWGMFAALCGVALAQLLSIARFTPIWKKQSLAYRGDPAGPNVVSVLSRNVKMSNRNYGAAIYQTREIDPDLAVFMETDQAWVDALLVLKERWPHMVAHPLENAYGMVLFSRFPLEDTEVRYIVMDEVPSITTTVRLPNGERFRFYAVHPEPPVPYADSAGRDAELLKIAEFAGADPLPCIVSGDLNDVAWSHTTRLFQRISRLLDPRVGRGFYNTFDARFFFARWPLDHLFHDPRFQIIDMQRLPPVGSDHFPMYFKLALTPSADAADHPDPLDESDREEAEAIKAEGEALDREAIGTDWEKT